MDCRDITFVECHTRATETAETGMKCLEASVLVSTNNKHYLALMCTTSFRMTSRLPTLKLWSFFCWKNIAPTMFSDL